MNMLYVGTKMLWAQPMTRAQFVAYRYPNQKANPDAGNPDDQGYLVEYTDGGEPNHSGHAGYISWSPKAQFEGAYLSMGHVDHLQPHQQRMIAERTQLSDRVEKLSAFMNGQEFTQLDEAEAKRLIAQRAAMLQYRAMLDERISVINLSEVPKPLSRE